MVANSMNKRTLGELLTTIGFPAFAGIFGTYSSISGSGNPLNLLWTVPLAIVSLPLLPLMIKGENILLACDKEDFDKRTANLPKVWLPKDYASIDAATEFGSTQYFVSPFFDEEPFATKEEAEKFLESLGYQEVVALNYEYHLDTYWIKQPLDISIAN